MENERLISWIAERGRQVETLTSVCTGSMLLGRATLLDHHHATTHWRSLDWMRKTFPDILVEDKLHVVEDGSVFTSAGISAGIDMALRIVLATTEKKSAEQPRVTWNTHFPLIIAVAFRTGNLHERRIKSSRHFRWEVQMALVS